MPLFVHRAPRADLLADALADRLRTPLPDPFATELVIVPAKGVERWLSQRLSHRLGTDDGDGVCAGVEFRSPRSLVADITGTGDEDPWAPDRLVWPLLTVIDDAAGEPWCRPLDRHLGVGDTGEEADLRRGRRYAVAHRLARLFAAYAAQRPAVLAAWERGEDTDGAGVTVPPDLDWQPPLWRKVVAEVGAPSPHERHTAVLAALRADPDAAALPERFSLFGHTRIPVTEADLLDALAAHRAVDLWLPHPSDTLWQNLSRTATPTGGTLQSPRRRAEDESHLHVRHPLLATLGRDVRELQGVLAPVIDATRCLESPATPTTLLQVLQHDITANLRPDGRWVLDPHDRSVQVHACHGSARQVEVLREVVLGLLADDPTLEPRDILVMCPDVEAFAPLIEASFGLGGLGRTSSTWHPGQQLEVRLADRSLVQTNPLLAVLERVLDLAGGRAEASRVLDLAAMPPVRRRFGFSDDDLETLAGWVDQAGVRWAFDAPHRAPYGLEGYLQNTWRFGLDRLLTGVAVSGDADRWFGATLPLDDVGSTSIDLAGRVAELVARLESVTDRLVGTHPVEHWAAVLRESLSSLTAVPRGEEWQTGQAQRELGALADRAGTGGGSGASGPDGTQALELRLPDVRALVAERLGGRPTRANFRTGSLTVCTMVPMRSVPHRVVCLLGLDDGVFPRSPASDGDDLLARRPLTGERDARGEDRQLLLDAVMAATEHLVITYAGADETTGARRPPAVPLGELVDALDLTARTHDDGPASAQVRIRHPLQRFDRRYLVAGSSVAPTADDPFSFDPAALAGALAARDRSATVLPPARTALLSAPLAPAPRGDVELEALARFLRHPVREFLRSRLDVRVPNADEEVLDGIPVELDHLGEWGVADRLLADLLRGRTVEDARQLEWRRGILPPGRLGWRLNQKAADKAAPVAELARVLTAGLDPRSLDVDVDLGDGRRLRGTVTDLYGDRIVKVGVSRLGARHHLDAWLPLLALCATWPDGPWSAGAVGRGGGRGGAARLTFGAVAEAGTELRRLVRLYDAGMREPIPLPLKTSHEYARAGTAAGGTAAARRAWQTTDFGPEWADAHHVLAWGPELPLEELMAAPPLTGEEVAHHDSRLGSLAQKLWRPVLDRVVHA